MAFKNWEERKKELEPLLKAGTTDERTVARLQLDHLRQANHRLHQTARPDEQPFMALLRNYIGKLEKQLYPNRLLRFLLRVKDGIFDGPAYLKQQTQQGTANMEALKAQLKTAGLGAGAGKLEEHLDPDLRSLSLPLDCQLNEGKRLKFDLHFEKDAYGDFQFYRLNGVLHQNGEIVRTHDFNLSDWPDLRSNQAWSLLEGRALKQTYTDTSGHQAQRWVELGPNGAQHYPPDHSFDIAKVVAGVPALTGSKPELLRYLENGQLVPTYWKVGRQYQSISVQADPGNGTLKFYDSKNQRVTSEKLNEQAQKQVTGIRTLGVPVQMRKGVKNGQRQ